MIAEQQATLEEFAPGFDLNKKWSLSEFLREAVRDLRTCLESGEYEYVPSIWYVPDEPFCQICLAGAFLAQTCKIDRTQALMPASGWMFNLPESFQGMIHALNDFRTGDIAAGIRAVGRPERGDFFDLKTQRRLAELLYADGPGVTFKDEDVERKLDRYVTGACDHITPTRFDMLDALCSDLEHCAAILEGIGL